MGEAWRGKLIVPLAPHAPPLLARTPVARAAVRELQAEAARYRHPGAGQVVQSAVHL